MLYVLPSFEEKPKKYKLVPLENRVSAIDESKIPIEMDCKIESALVPCVEELIHEMVGYLLFMIKKSYVQSSVFKKICSERKFLYHFSYQSIFL